MNKSRLQDAAKIDTASPVKFNDNFVRLVVSKGPFVTLLVYCAGIPIEMVELK